MKHIFLVVLSFFVFSVPAMAHSNATTVKVLNVRPVYKYVNVHKPVTLCPNTQLRSTKQSMKNIVLGSVIGGTIGHISADNAHKQQTAALGALFGGIVGSQIPLEHHSHNKSVSCTTLYEAGNKTRVLSGYHYWYKFKGKTIQRFSRHKPPRYISI